MIIIRMKHKTFFPCPRENIMRIILLLLLKILKALIVKSKIY